MGRYLFEENWFSWLYQ